MTPARLLAAAAAALVALLAAPAARAQQALWPLKPCYVSVAKHKREVLGAYASGFARNANVDVTVDGVTRSGVANANGIVDLTRTAAPYQRRGQRPFTVTVAEHDNRANAVSATSLVTDLAVHVRPRKAATSDRVRFRGRGFTQDRPIWGHYVFRDRVRRTVRLAERPDGACGTFSVRRRQIPMPQPRRGRWLLQVDQRRHWSPHPASVFVPVEITVERRIGAR